MPREHRAARDDGPDERRERSLRRRIHAHHRTHRRDARPARLDGRRRLFTPRSPQAALLFASAALQSRPCVRLSMTSSTASSPTSSDICGQVEVAVHEATKALLTGDVHTAEQVISADKAIDAARERVDDTAFALLSLQQPVAGDLRMIVSALRMVSELERMGDLSVHVAKIARLRVPAVAVPDELRPTMEQMAETAEDMVRRVRRHHRRPRRRGRDRARPRRRGHGPAAPPQLHRAARPPTGARRRGGRRHRPARPLLRAHRRPRRLGRQPGRLRRHRRAAARATDVRSVERPWVRPTLVGDAAAAAAASGSRYSPPDDGGTHVLVERGRPAACRWGC